MKNTAINHGWFIDSLCLTPIAERIFRLITRDEKTARAIQKAITPDNIGAPDGMHIMAYVD